MTEMWLVAAIILTAIVLFTFEIFPVDKISFLILGALVGFGLIMRDEAASGFGNPATVTVGCMLALSLGIERTGALKFLAYRIIDFAGGTEWKVLLYIMAAVGLLSAFINNTAAVAIFLPLCLAVARERDLEPSKLLMPMSFAAIFAGTCTLIGTSTNLLVYGMMQQQLGAEIGMFDIAPLGLIFFVTGTLYLFFAGRHLIPSRRSGKLGDAYNLKNFASELILKPRAGFVGKTIPETRLGDRYGIDVVEVWRGDRKHLVTEPGLTLQGGDILLVHGSAKGLVDVQQSEQGLELKALQLADSDLESDSITLVEAVISPTSRLVETTLKEVGFRQKFQATTLAIRQHGHTIQEKLATTRLRSGDSLLLLADRGQLEMLRSLSDFLIVDEMRVPIVRTGKAVWAISIFAAVILIATIGFLSVAEAALVGVGLMLLAGCVRPAELYAGLSWTTLVMLGCLIPLGTAMEKSGLAGAIAALAVGQLKAVGPQAVLSGVYLLTSLLTEFLSNNAAAVLMVPIAISIADQLGVSPMPFCLAVLFAGSASFMTPVGYQTNTMIFGPGGYRFSDFLKVGTPLNVMFWLIASVCIPVFWPF